MIVKFETERGYRLFDNVDYVDWTDKVKNEDGNQVQTLFDPSDTLNWEWIHGCVGEDDMIPRITGIDAKDSQETRYHFHVDDKFGLDATGKTSMFPRLVCLQQNKRLRVFYTEAQVFLLNDSGKTIDRI